MSYERANVFQRLLRRFAASGPGSWLFVHVMHHIDGTVFRLSRGRFTLGSLIAGLPVAMLTTTGRRAARRAPSPCSGCPRRMGWP